MEPRHAHIGSRSNVLFILAAAFGLLAALGRPWYAPAAPALDPRRRHRERPEPGRGLRRPHLARGRRPPAARRAGTRFTSTDTILVALALIAVVSALGSLVPAIEQPCRELLRLVTLAMLGIVVVKLVNTPGRDGLVERRQGAWIALGVTGIMASSASALYAAPLTRRKRGPSLAEYQPHQVAPPRPPRSTRGPTRPPVYRS